MIKVTMVRRSSVKGRKLIRVIRFGGVGRVIGIVRVMRVISASVS